jgi:hypothetical protein
MNHKEEPQKGTRKSHKEAQTNHERQENRKVIWVIDRRTIDRKEIPLFVPFCVSSFVPLCGL